MKIAVISGNGRVGSLIAKEALDRGHNVTIIARSASIVEGTSEIRKDIFDLTKEDLNNFEVVICAFGVWEEEKFGLYSTTTKHLCDILSGSETRLLIVGGAGSLYIDTTHKIQALDTEGFPAEYRPLASAAAKALGELRLRDDVKWTYFSPAGFFDAEGKRTGEFIIGGEEAIVNSKGESYISYADYAIAMVNEIEDAKHIKARFTIVSK